MRQEATYYEEHLEELLKQYPEQWVGILDQKVVGVAPDARGLLTDLKTRGFSLRRVFVKHLTRQEQLWVLAQ